MKKNLMCLVMGFIIGVGVIGGAYAATGTKNLYDVMTSGIKIVVDGKELHPVDAKGNKVEPFIYNGTTYLPVRAVADALDKAVYWDGPEFTVYLGNMKGKLEYPTVRIEDMTSIAQSPRKTDVLTDNYGNRYDRAIYNYHDNCNMEYLLNMRYSRFKGTLYVAESETDGGSVYLTIEADGKTLYTSPDMTKTSRPVEVDVNVKGYNDVKIKFSNGSSDWIKYSGLYLCLADAGFYQ